MSKKKKNFRNFCDRRHIFINYCPYCIYRMVQIDPIDRLMRAALVSDEEFIGVLNDILKKDLRITIRELSQESGIAQSSLYKILHSRRSPNLSTLRAIVRALRRVLPAQRRGIYRADCCPPGA